MAIYTNRIYDLGMKACIAILLFFFLLIPVARAQTLDADQVIDSPYTGWVHAISQFVPLAASSSPYFDNFSFSNILSGLVGVANGGTGSTTLSGILKGNGTSAVGTLGIGSGLTFDGTTLSATGGGGSGSGNVATSSTETATYIPFWSSTGATPATLSGGSANLTFNGTTFATKYASTTAISASGQIYATGGNAVGSPNFCLTSACTTGLYSNGGNVALTTSGTGITWGALSGVTSWYPNTDNVRNLGGASNRWLNYWGSGTATTSTLYITGLTAGSVPFINSLGLVSQDNANFFWDSANARLGIATSTPQSAFVIGNSWGRNVSCTSTTGTCTFTNGNNSLSRTVVVSNPSTSVIGNGGGVLFTLASGGATAINAGALDIVNENATFANNANGDSSMVFQTALNGSISERMRLTSNGWLGIGTTTPTQILHIAGSATNNYIQLDSQSLFRKNLIGVEAADNIVIAADDSNLGGGSEIRFRVDGTQRAVINDSGNFGLGTTTPNANSLLSLAGSAYVGGKLTATGTITFTGLSNGCLQSTSGVISSTGSACGGSSSVVGTIATSSAETSGRIPFYTSTGAYPALLSGGASGFTWDNSGSKLTATNASTTALSSGYASSTEARFGGLYLPNSKPTSTSTPLSIDSNGQVRSTVIATSTTPFSLTTSAGQSVFVIAKGNCADSSTEQEAQLSYNSVVVDTVKIDGDANANGAYALTWVGFPGAATADIAVACTVTAAENTKITVFKY